VVDLQSGILGVFSRAKWMITFSLAAQKLAWHDKHQFRRDEIRADTPLIPDCRIDEKNDQTTQVCSEKSTKVVSPKPTSNFQR